MTNTPEAGRARLANLAGARAALKERPQSQYLRQLVKDMEDSMKAPNPDLPEDSNGLMAMRPMD